MSDPEHNEGAPPAEEPLPPPDEVAPEEAPAAEETAAEASPEDALLPEGNALRPLRGGLCLAAGMLGAFVLMAIQKQLRFGVPLGALAVLVATFGVLDLIGSFDDPDERVHSRVSIAQLAKPLSLFAAGFAAMAVFVTLAVDGRLTWLKSPVITAGVLIPAAFLTAIVGAYRTGEVLEVWDRRPDGSPRPLLHRHGFWLVLTTTLLYLPVLGSHSLSDPWETHYGEVSREILSRNDWISLWWAQEGWFWSKPILDFWLQALCFASFGVRYSPDHMLSAMREGRVPWPEWAARLPVFLFTLLAVYLLYKAVSHVFGRRAGLLGGLVLVTMPQWFLVTHQTMTDMPFVAPMAAAMAMLLLGAHTDPEEKLHAYEVSFGALRLRFSAFHLVIGAVVACALPQILYLFSRNLEVGISGIHAHLDAFSAGSPGNCGLPGNEACHAAQPVLRGLHPALQGLIWAQALALIVYLSWGERRRQRIFFLAAWLFAALSTMAKGPAGVVLPVLCALAYVMVSKRYRDLLRLEIAAGVLIVLAVALPWFVAMYARHGQPFTDRLLFHDMFKRAFTHVHDTNEGDDVSFRFYVWQLGYAMFPWTGLAPAGLVYWLRRREEGDRRSDASVFLVMWFVFAFSLFSLMLTKFHHYILPAVPPAAMLTGVLLDAMWGGPRRRRAGAKDAPEPAIEGDLATPGDDRRPPDQPPPPVDDTLAPSYRDIALYAVGLGGGVALTVYGVARTIAAMRAATPTQGGLAAFVADVPFAQILIGLGVSLLIVTVTISRRLGLDPASEEPQGDAALPEGAPPSSGHAALTERFEQVQLGALGVAGAVLVFFVGRDLSATYEGLPNQVRLLHLFTYNYRRAFPTFLDFTPSLWAFTLVASALMFLLLVRRIRRHVTAALLALGLSFAVWGLDVYFMKTSPHWGQRETVLAYYNASREVQGPLIAYQMNWKGENFYTSNHVPAFVSSGKKFQDYLGDEKKKGGKVFYFLTEHSRMSTLQNEIGATKSFEKLTPPELNNKFGLVRAIFE
ncbi:MAG: glycosyltransferase family 39 protein [Minicystis sp.]